MANREILKDYLVNNKNGYLTKIENNNKTIMISGKWGSGKTYFWQKDIATDEFKEKLKENKKAYSYVSLYGKTSIESIESDLLMQAYNSVVGDADIVSKTCSVFTNFGKNLAPRSLSSSFEGAQKLVDEEKFKKAGEFLNNGGLICFDDFERKSKDIDLNDLFGFISQLTIEFECKVVIILNEDVFDGEEKKVFSNVKEKTVSKFLNYSPSIDELFNLIYESDNKEYKKLDDYRDKILETIKETEELNARIYIQVLDNLLEWLKEREHNEDIIRGIILVNINFILYHTVFEIDEKEKYIPKRFYDKIKKYSLDFSNVRSILDVKDSSFPKSFDDYFNNLEFSIKGSEKLSRHSDFLQENLNIYKSIYFSNKFDLVKNLNNNVLQKINTFIESGILPNE